MILFPHCKINLGLSVTAKRSDGYHNIESIFLPVFKINDILEVIFSEDDLFHLTLTGTRISGKKEENSCYKAWLLLHHEKKIGGVKCHLHKIIPAGAGLGGGSADGAFMLKALNELFALNLSTVELKSYALRIGSDCPFFIDLKPSFVSGRGEVLSPVEADFSNIFIVLVHPGIHLSTSDAFSMLNPGPASFDLRKIGGIDKRQWREKIKNDFEDPVIKKFPAIGKIKIQLYEAGAFYSAMSGSGSAVYGLFDSDPGLDEIFAGYFCRKTVLK
ncbi:MAG: 4-(cytidine 5'-diphospho)-2-C-methyl-D-erythritol kinase [Crocinitomicaceae bacterium]|nr:4-(cytidine 5'-diphospho)-2-C-methyl-D-erythritol kinase [Crocinitomicaceae bacterium]